MTERTIQPIDLVIRLRKMAGEIDDRPLSEVVDLLNEAAEIILVLRDLVGIRRDIELEDEEPQGRA